MIWQEVLRKGVTHVNVLSYGYMERGILSSHYEPFSRKRKFTFKVTPHGLHHSWLILEDDENELIFQEIDGEIILDDPDLFARPE